jgi:hypothetical protein
MSKKHRGKHSASIWGVEGKVDKVDKDVKGIKKEARLFAKFEGLVAEIIIILLVGICVGTIAGYWLGSLNAQTIAQNQGGQTGTNPNVDVDALVIKVQDYLNTNLLTAAAKAQGVNGFIVENSREIGSGVYELSVFVEDANKVKQQIAVIYSTPERLILGGGQVYDLNTPVPAQPATPETPSNVYTKSEVPEVKLFIMAFCPYGIQAASAFQSAVELLNEKMNFKMGYVIYSNYAKQGGSKWEDYCTESSEKYCSMHGVNEVKEDVRQMCIQKYAPDKFWAYMSKLMTDYDNSQVSATNIADKWEGYATAAGIDVAQIKTCASSEQDALLAEQVALNNQYGV